MPLVSPLMPIPQHFNISVTPKFFWLCLLAWPILGLTQSATPPAVALAKKFLVTELLKCDVFMAANLVTDKTHSSQMFFFPAAPAQLLRSNFGSELQFGPILTVGIQTQNILQFVCGPLQAL